MRLGAYILERHVEQLASMAPSDARERRRRFMHIIVARGLSWLTNAHKKPLRYSQQLVIFHLDVQILELTHRVASSRGNNCQCQKRWKQANRKLSEDLLSLSDIVSRSREQVQVLESGRISIGT